MVQVPKSRRTALTREATKPAWILEAEEHVRALEGIEGLSIVWDGRSISEIHVVSSSDRAPRLISRDVETALKAREIKVDHRVISVAQVRKSANGDAAHAGNGHAHAPGAPAPATDPPPNGPTLVSMPNSRPVDSMTIAPHPIRPVRFNQHVPESEETSSRLRFQSVNVMTVGFRATADVELSCGGQGVLGTRSGIGSKLGTPRLVAAAALEALRQLVSEDVEFDLEAIDFVELGGQRLALVSVAWLEDRRQRVLFGTAPVDVDPHQSVVNATLDAVNRSFGRLRQKERIEYELRPTSVEV